MLRIAVVDDKKEDATQIRHVLEKCFQDIDEEFVLRYYECSNELIWDLQEKQYYDVFFLDIEMSVNGLEVARSIRDLYLSPYIIFVTAHTDYSMEGYEYNAFRYIMKEELEEKIPLALKSILNIQKEKIKRYYTIETGSILEKIEYEEIYYIYIKGKYSYICTTRGISRVRKPLKMVHGELNSPEFVFADKGHIVNLRHVMSLKEKGVQLRNGECIEVSAARLKHMKREICKYWGSEK